MNITRQSKTWPYDLVKGIILLILLGLMLYSRPDMSAQIQRQLGLPFGTVTVLDAPQVTGSSATTLSGHTQSGALVEVFAGEASLGTATAGPDGSWSLPVTLPTGTYQLRAQARDPAGAALGAAAVLEWSSEQQVADAAAAAPTPATAAQAAAAGTPAAGDTNTKADTEAGTAAGTTADSGADSGSPAGETEAETAAPSTPTDANTDANTGSQSTGAASSAAAQGFLSAAQVADGAANLSGVGTPGTTVEIVAAPAAVAGGTAGAGTSGGGNKTAEIEGTASGTNAETGSAKDDALGKEAAAKVVLGSVVVAADGTWQLSAKINPGEYSLAVRTLDSDGAIVDESDTVPLSVPVTSAGEAPAAGDAATDEAGQSTPPDAAASAAVTGTVPVTGSASTSATTTAASAATPAVTSAAAPQVSAPVVAGDKVTLTGMAAPGGAVELVTNDEVLAEAVADADGLWIVTVQLDPGLYALRIRAVSSADESIQYSRVVSLTVPAASGTTVAAGESITPTTASVVASTTAPTATQSAASAVAAAVPATGTMTLATPATKAIAAGTATTPVAAASSTETLTTAVTTTTPITATTATTVGAAAAKTPAATPASAVPSGTATPTAPAAASAALTTTTAAAAAGVIAATATAPGAPPTIREPEISGNTLTLSGTGTPGTSVEIVSGTTVLGKTTVTADGTWSLASEVKPGSYRFQVVRRDASGEVISQSPVVSLDIPAESTVPELDKPEIAADKTITLTGSGTPGSTIEIVQDGAVIATTDVQDDGQWSYSYPAAKTGNVQVAAQLSGQPATRTRPVIVVVPVVVAPAPTVAATATAEPTIEVAAAAEPASAGGDSGSSGGQAHVVEPGDTLTSLALEYLGSERRYPEIVAATNIMAKQDPAYKQITDPNLIVVGQQLWIPAP